MSTKAQTERFQRAIFSARDLPPDLLTNSQKLKLYALYKQTESPAPTEPPSKTHVLARAKWEAWNDVRSLSEQQAMESYCAIIEGLVSMMSQAAAGAMPTEPTEPPPPPPPSQPPAAPQPAPKMAAVVTQAVRAAARPPPPPVLDGDGEPKVDCTTWSTSALTVPPGGSVVVPIDASEPCLCTYTFNTIDTTSPVGFSIGVSGASAQLVTLRQAIGEGKFEVPSAGLLNATLDNSQAMFIPLMVKCTVSLEPLAQLRRLEEHQLRASLRAELADNERATKLAAEREGQLQAEEKALRGKLAELNAQVAQVQRSLASKGSEIVQNERQKMELAGEAASLKMQLRKKLWSMAGKSWLEALPKS